MNLHMYHDDYEWVIAESPADATKVWCEATGGSLDMSDDERWGKQSPDSYTSMWCDADGKVCEIGVGAIVHKSNREWIESHGRCYLGGIEQ